MTSNLRSSDSTSTLFSKQDSSPYQSEISFSGPSYSIYEKALKKELLPHQADSSFSDYHDLQFSKLHSLSSKSLISNLNKPPGPTGLDSSFLPSSQARSFSPAPMETDDDPDNGGSSPSSKAWPGSHQPSQFSSRRQSRMNSNAFGNSYLNQDDDNNRWLDNYLERVKDLVKVPFNSRPLDYGDEPASTKENSVIETNFSNNQMIWRNLGDVNGYAHETQPQVVPMRKKQYENRVGMGNFPGQIQASNYPNYLKETITQNTPVFHLKIKVEDPEKRAASINKEKNEGEIQHERAIDNQGLPQHKRGRPVTSVKGLLDSIGSAIGNTDGKIMHPSQLVKKKSKSPNTKTPCFNVQIRTQSPSLLKAEEFINKTEVLINKCQETIEQNRRKSSDLGFGSMHNESRKTSVSRGDSRGHSNQGRTEANEVKDRSHKRNYSNQKNISNTHAENNRNDNKGNRPQGKTSISPARVDIVNMSRSGSISSQTKTYWQLKNAAKEAKGVKEAENSKKNALENMLKKTQFPKETREAPRTKETNPKSSVQLSAYAQNFQNSRREQARVPMAKSLVVSNNSSYFVSSRLEPQAGLDRSGFQSSSRNTTFEDTLNSYAGSRVNSRRDTSQETKRSLSGKAHIKTGDEPGRDYLKIYEDMKEDEVVVHPQNKRVSQPKESSKEKPRGYYQINQEQRIQKSPQKTGNYYVHQLSRGRDSVKSAENLKTGSRSFDLPRAMNSKSMIMQAEQGARSNSESRRSSKDILKSIKSFSENVVQSAKEFFIQRVGHSKTRTKCSCSKNLKSNEETCSKAQNWLFSKYKRNELEYLKKTYEKIRDLPDIQPACKKQIGLDIKRTHPENEYFSKEEGVQTLERLLQCYAKYDPKIGYVQGMNFIAASILYHAEEFVAFWIIVLIFEKAEMRDIFMQDLPGLAKHSQIVDFLILHNLPDLYSHFCTHNIIVEMFCTEWICGLFGSVIPLEQMDLFLDGFIAQGWPFFYKFVLALLKSFEKELREATDMSDIMVVFKSGINKRERNVFSNTKTKVDWRLIIQYASQIELDSTFIHKLLMKFDQETKRFIVDSRY